MVPDASQAGRGAGNSDANAPRQLSILQTGGRKWR